MDSEVTAGQAVSVGQVVDVIAELDELVLIYGLFSRCFHGVFTVFCRWDPCWDPCVFAPIPADPAGFLGAGIRIPPKLGAVTMIPAGR